MSYSPLPCLSLGSEVSVMTSMEDEEVGDLEEKKEVGEKQGVNVGRVLSAGPDVAFGSTLGA